MADSLHIHTTRFGALQVPRRDVLLMPEGMMGFTHHRHYVLVRQRDDDVLTWLQSCSDPALAFPMVLPWAFHWQYELKISDDQLDKLQLAAVDDLSIWAVCAIPNNDIRQGACNLLAPVLVNDDSRVAYQVVNRIPGYTTYEPLTRQDHAWPVSIRDDRRGIVMLDSARVG